MDNMLIRLIIVLFAVVIKSTLAKENSSLLLKNDSIDNSLLNTEVSHKSKFKRALSDLEFKMNFSDASNIFHDNKIDRLINHKNDNIHGFMPPSSIKVKRSNSQSLGTYDKTFESSNHHLNAQRTLKSVDSKEITNHNKDQDALSQVHHITYNNQITPPYFESFLAQPNYVANKFSTASSGIKHKYHTKHQYNGHPKYTEFRSSIPVYHSMVQIPIHAITTNNHKQVEQLGSQYAPYAAQLIQNLRTLEPISKKYAPSHRNIHQQPFNHHQLKTYFQNVDHHPYNYVQYSTLPKVEINGNKVSLPILQLQANEQFPSYIQTIETTPVIFSSETGLQYKTNPNFDISLDFIQPKNINKNLRTNLNAPLTSLPYNYGSRLTQIYPVRSSSGTVQFPQFKGASIGQEPNRIYSSYPNDYQEFKSQTQLHFDGNLNNNPNNIMKHELYNKPLEKIRTDVEVINKKKPIPPLPKDDDDESSESDDDEDFKTTDSYFPKPEYNEFVGLPRKYFRLSHLQGDFKPSKSFPLSEYDIIFDKQKKMSVQVSNHDNDEDDGDVNLAAKYRYRAKSNYDNDGNLDDDDEHESAEDTSQSKYTTYSTQEKLENQSSNEDNDHEEEILQDKREKIMDVDQEQKKYKEELDKTYRNKQSKFSHLSHQIKDYVKSEENQTPSYVRHWMDDKLELPEKSSKRTQHTYHDETQNSSIKSSSLPSSVRYFSENDKLIEGIDKAQSMLKKINNKSPKLIWQESYGLKANSRVDEREHPILRKKKSEEVNSPIKIRKLLQEHPMMSFFKVSTNQPKQLITTDSGSSALSSRPLWESEDSYSRSSNPTPRSLFQTNQGPFNPATDHGDMFLNSKQT